MNTEQAYNDWASQYDTNINKTRDLEAIALRTILAHIQFQRCLEIGSGTGKNTLYLLEKARAMTCVDLSEEMLAKAKAKIGNDTVQFIKADITSPWDFRKQKYDLVTFSLMLEHIKDLAPVLKEAAASLDHGGYLYIGELHPFKQYSGSKARFETAEGVQVVDCFNHHVSDFLNLTKQQNLSLVTFEEYFDDDNRNQPPRVLGMLFKKL